MKKFTLLCAAALALTANAEVITLDLTTATDMELKALQYETKNIPVYNGNMQDVWDSTYATYWATQYIYANDAKFMFSHTGSAYGAYVYWNGFTVSKVASDTLNQFACVAKGGVAGVGTPFLVSYENDNMVSFNAEYYPQELQICQSTYTLQSLLNGDGYAKKFTKNDTLALTIYGIDGTWSKTDSLVYYLAVDSTFNTGWDKVDLSSFKKCMGLQFHLTSTDNSTCDGGVTYYMNTPAYFALDGLKISDEAIASVDNSPAATTSKIQKVIINGQLYLIRDNVVYNLQGQVVE